MNYEVFKDLLLKDVVTSDFNARNDFSEDDIDSLRRSIVAQGQLVPILARPLKDGKFEIVAGERRYTVMQMIDAKSIKAIVREMSDEEAQEVMLIENIQRENLTDFEEAAGFLAYTRLQGEDAVALLAEKTGKGIGYVNRRLAALALPQSVRDMWQKEELTFGHLTQLARLSDMDALENIITHIKNEILHRKVSIVEVKEMVNRVAPWLKTALFSTITAGCSKCKHNSTIQRDLFEAKDTNKLRCLNAPCFHKNQQEFISTSWIGSKTQIELGTRSAQYVNPDGSVHFFYTNMKTPSKCKRCDEYATLFSSNGEVRTERACLGEESCYKEQTTSKGSGGIDLPAEQTAKKKAEEKVARNGEYFREMFFTERIPVKVEKLKVNDLAMKQIALIAILNSNRKLHLPFYEVVIPPAEHSADKYFSLESDHIVELVLGQDLKTVNKLIAMLSAMAVTSDNYQPAGRRMIAECLGINIAEEWSMTEEYLKKKNKDEILAMGEAEDGFGWFDDTKFDVYKQKQPYATKVVDDLKKTELIDAIINSGIDFTGMVPADVIGK
jgi:ParB/RepB/Spo0J family partition protein